jgi:DNA-binding Xre family transcriptional regulator
MELDIKGLPGFETAISKKGILRKTLAEKIGIPYPALWKIVSGELKRIDPAILRKISTELGCSVDDLLNPPQPPHRSPKRTRGRAKEKVPA